MTDRYVKHTGSNTSPYDTWAKAATTLAVAAAASSGGDRIFVSHQHAESNAGAITIDFSGAGDSAPIQVLCVNDGAEPPTTLATGATVTSTGNAISLTTLSFCAAYLYGISFISQGATARTITLSANTACTFTYENCTFNNQSGTASGNQNISMGASVSSMVTLLNCSFRFTEVPSNAISVASAGHRIIGGSFLSGSATPVKIFQVTASLTVSGLDLSNLGSTVTLFGTNCVGYQRMFNCKLPQNWSGSLANSYHNAARVEMTNTDASGTNYRQQFGTYGGNGYSETTFVRSGGATDGVTPLSWKLTTNAFGTGYPGVGFSTPEIVRRNDVVGVPVTATIEILHDSATNLKDDEVWLEVMYLSSAGAPLGAFISDARVPMASAADQTASSATWTTTGMSNANKQKLSVTLTPNMAGHVHATVKMAKLSKTIYVCPRLDLTS